MGSLLRLLDGDWRMLYPLGEITSRRSPCLEVSALFPVVTSSGLLIEGVVIIRLSVCGNADVEACLGTYDPNNGWANTAINK